MALTSQTPYMSLTLPNPTQQLGPLWATQLNTALRAVDSHTHVAGQGQQVPTAGININADLAYNSYNLTLIRSARFFSQTSKTSVSAGTDLGCLFVAGAELWYNDTAGNQVQLTASGAVNVSSAGQISGMSGTTATATYSSGSTLFTFSSATNTPAFMTIGKLNLSLSGASPAIASILPSSSMGASFNLTLPSALPASNSFVTSDTSGNLGYLTKTGGITGSMIAALTIDTANLANSSVTTAKITDSNVTTAKIADSNVTTAKIADSNVTTAKIADSNVTGAKIAAGTITGSNLSSTISLPAASTLAGRPPIVQLGSTYLAVIRGAVSSGGSPIGGEAFTSTRIGVGRYNVTFNTTFTSTPAVTANVIGAVGYCVIAAGGVPGGIEVDTFNSVGGAADNAFTFMAIG